MRRALHAGQRRERAGGLRGGARRDPWPRALSRARGSPSVDESALHLLDTTSEALLMVTESLPHL